MKCPRRAEVGSGVFKLPDEDNWRQDNTCSYCGALNPDELMTRLEAGDVELGPTDKNYKVYVENKGGLPFKQTHRIDNDRSLDQSKWLWQTDETEHSKFYFHHFNDAQKIRFIELLNERKLNIGYPHHFYTMPFFIAPLAK